MALTNEDILSAAIMRMVAAGLRDAHDEVLLIARQAIARCTDPVVAREAMLTGMVSLVAGVMRGSAQHHGIAPAEVNADLIELAHLIERTP